MWGGEARCESRSRLRCGVEGRRGSSLNEDWSKMDWERHEKEDDGTVELEKGRTVKVNSGDDVGGVR